MERIGAISCKIDDKTITTDSFDLGNSASISIRNEPIYNEEDGVNIDKELYEKIKNKKTLIVLNQVKRVQKVYEKIKQRLDSDEDKPKGGKKKGGKKGGEGDK